MFLQSVLKFVFDFFLSCFLFRFFECFFCFLSLFVCFFETIEFGYLCVFVYSFRFMCFCVFYAIRFLCFQGFLVF